MRADEIRETFLRFFEERGHRRYPSASLIPNDPTLLLTTAGMVPFKPYFLGDADPPTPRATSCQKSARTTDIENVGRTARHLTLFEMLGNFSFGDYFKRQAVRWAWELSLEHLDLDPGRIWATVHVDDDEAPAIWLEETDVPEERIQALDADNFWRIEGVAGPGGPTTELFYDRGEDFGEAGGPAVNGERYLEYYNLVFMQYQLDEAGGIQGDLPNQGVDTGMGLERMAAIEQDVTSVFETDVFRPIVARAEELTGAAYGEDDDADISLRVIAEHSRAATFLIADGILPAKEGRGYVLRRLMRRVVRHARLLGSEEPLLVPMVDAVIATMRTGYPELDDQRELVTRVAGAEEKDFAGTLRQGLAILEDAVEDAQEAGREQLPGDAAFKLHDTYGFPVDLTLEIVEEQGLGLDRDEFDRLMEEQRRRARAARKTGDEGTPVEVYRQAAGKLEGEVEFLGYDTTAAGSTLGALVTPGGTVTEVGEGDEVEVVLTATPFYAEGGGQVGDRGVLETPTGRLEVADTYSPIEGLIVHRAKVVAGEVAEGQGVTATVDPEFRVATERSHSATHVLHATVRELLGSHAQQAGSLVEPGRLRFDFPHFEQVPRETLAMLEETVNERVLRDPEVHADRMHIDEAKAEGAIALFGEKYGDVVRVVTIGDFSKELCGGTHVASGARVGGIVIVREESIGANQRRIEALTGHDAYAHGARERLIAEEVARMLDVRPDDVVDRVSDLVERLRDAEKELDQVRAAGLSHRAEEIADEAERQDGLAVVTRQVDVPGADELRQLALEIRGHLRERGVVVLGTTSGDGKAQMVAVLTQDLADEGIQARDILHPAAQVLGGGAGGQGELAQAGGREGAKLDAALSVAADEARAAAGAA
ncbi:MAG: alanine--tRNA ligase [Actinobacteria bacterium]|nr:alanine--tRNA ligase [Actinomycetota bacterium]